MITSQSLRHCGVISLIGLFVSCTYSAQSAPSADVSNLLKDYVSAPEAAFGFEVARTFPIVGAEGHILKLTSQTWRDSAWDHWLFVVMPEDLRYPDKALLIIEGGRNRQDIPTLDPMLSVLMASLSNQIKGPIALLQQVPNQPLKGGLREDALIAYTFDKFVSTGESDYPLLFPMVKSAVAAMDAIDLWSQQQFDRPIEQFFVTGASKRGWTTWLTAAVDERVTGIAPMVIDVLNMQPQMEQQLKTYGTFSPMIHDYVERGLMEHFDTPRGKQLLAMVDPYSYRRDITVPKMIVLGTNDPYWTVDAANLYVPGLFGPTWMHYSPNAGHSLSADSVAGLSRTLDSMASFVRMNFAGQRPPEVRWRDETPNRLVVQWDGGDGKAVLWTAQSPNRDFRKARWVSQPLDGQGRAEVTLKQPEQGWQAWFVEVVFGGTYPIRLTTTMTVLPDVFPHDLSVAKP